eukprot:g811.t1
MGFPVDWAIRASDFEDALANESVAVSWIIEQMENENAKTDDEHTSYLQRRGSNQYGSSRQHGNDDREHGEHERRDHDRSGATTGVRSSRAFASAHRGDQVGIALGARQGGQSLDELECEDLNYEAFYTTRGSTVDPESYAEMLAIANTASEDDLWILSGSCDIVLAVLYAREALAALFRTCHREFVLRPLSLSATHKALVSAFTGARAQLMLVDLLKLAWFRASTGTEDGCHATYLQSLLRVLLRHDVDLTENTEETDTKPRNRSPGPSRPSLEPLLVEEALSHFTRARGHDFEHIVWGAGARAPSIINISDSDALSRPFVEWAAWILESLLAIDAEHRADASCTDVRLSTVDAVAFATLVQEAIAGNMALKHFTFRVLARVLWVIRERLLALASSMEKAQTDGTASSKTISVPRARALLEGTPARSAAMEYVLALDEHQLIHLFTNRYRKEKGSRVLHSVYLQSVFALLVASRQLRAVVCTAAPSTSAGAAFTVPGAAEDDICGDIFPWQPLDGELAPPDANSPVDVPGVQMPKLVVEEAAVSSVALSWSCAAPHVSDVDSPPALNSPVAQGSPGTLSLDEPQLDSSADTLGLSRSSLRTATLEEASSGRYALEVLVDGQGFVPVPGAQELPGQHTYTVEHLEADTAYTFRLRMLLSGPAQPAEAVTNSIRVHTPAELLFMLDPDNVGPNLELSNGNFTVTNRVNKKWNAVRATVGFSTGLHTWRVHINKCISKNIFIGVMDTQAALDNYVGSDRYGWGYLANKAIWHNKGKVRSYGELFKEGDVIEARLDMDAGTLAFSRNGRDLGIAVDGLSGEMYPSFSMYNKDDQLTLILSDSGSAASQGGGAVAQQLVARTCIASDVLRPSTDASAGVSALPLQLTDTCLRHAYRHLLLWQRGTIRRHRMSGGDVVDVDVSRASCQPFGFSAGSTVTWSSGAAVSATVLGVSNHCLWVQPQGSEEAVPCSLRACRELQLHDAASTGPVSGTSPLLQLQTNPLDEAQLNSTVATAAAEEKASVVGSEPIAFPTFAAWMGAKGAGGEHRYERGPAWSLEQDVQLVAHLSALSRARGVSVWSLAWHEVTEAPLLAFGSLRGVSEARLRCRVALLRFVNDLLRAPILPLVGFPGAAAGGGGRSYWTAAARVPRAPGVPTAHRALLFTEDKHVLLTRVLRLSAAHVRTRGADDSAITEPPNFPSFKLKLPDVSSGSAGVGVGGVGGGAVSGGVAALSGAPVFAQVCAQLAQIAPEDLRHYFTELQQDAGSEYRHGPGHAHSDAMQAGPCFSFKAKLTRSGGQDDGSGAALLGAGAARADACTGVGSGSGASTVAGPGAGADAATGASVSARTSAGLHAGAGVSAGAAGPNAEIVGDNACHFLLSRVCLELRVSALTHALCLGQEDEHGADTDDAEALFYLGQIMGMALRSGAVVPLSLPPSAWEALADAGIVGAARHGSACASLRDGLTSVVPPQAFDYFTPAEVEQLFCGRLAADAVLLGRRAELEGFIAAAGGGGGGGGSGGGGGGIDGGGGAPGTAAPVVRWLWEWLAEAPLTDRSLFAQFAWGVAAAPSHALGRRDGGGDGGSGNVRGSAPHDLTLCLRAGDAADDAELESDGCAPHCVVRLPRYSSPTVLRARLRVVLHATLSGNAATVAGGGESLLL